MLSNCSNCVYLTHGALCTIYSRRIKNTKSCQYFAEDQKRREPVEPFGMVTCRKCKAIGFPVMDSGSGDHAGRLRCFACGSHRKWISKHDVLLMSQLIKPWECSR